MTAGMSADMSADDVLVVAGEASGDLHGARLLARLAELAPGLRPFGLGGDEMRAAGLDAVAHSSEIAVVGITEALRVLPRAWRIYRRLLAEAERRRAASAVLIDSPEFNLRLARRLSRRGVRVLYYISPQIWAWRQGRVRTIAACVDRMLVVFPFEVDFYRRHGVDVIHVGHPLIDEIPPLEQAWERPPPAPGEPFVVALLPGSRSSEVRSLLPAMLESARRLGESLPVAVRLIQAPTVDARLVDALIAAGPALEIERVRRDRFPAIAGAHLALCASGTATLEVGLLGTPMIVLYRLKLGSYILARLLVDLEHFSMVNLVLGRRAVPELAQRDAAPERVAAEARRLLESPAEIEVMRQALAELRPRLGAGGASRRAAEVIADRIADLGRGRAEGGT
jgi:lipid-A-disaccharide synthase